MGVKVIRVKEASKMLTNYASHTVIRKRINNYYQYIGWIGMPA